MILRPHLAATLAALLLLAGPGMAGAATHSWQVTDFRKIRVEGPFDVRVHAGQPSGVRAIGPQASLDRLVVEQRGDTLVIHPDRSAGWDIHVSTGKMVVDVGTRALDGATLGGSGALAIDRMRGDAVDLALSGSGDLDVADMAAAQTRISLTGSGDLTVAGRTRSATALVTGSGDLHGGGLAAGDATVTLVGSGDLELGASGTATVKLAGSGDVSIVGPARCTVSRTGSGDVRCAHQDPAAD